MPTKTRFLQFAVVGLLLLNLALVAFFTRNRPPRHNDGTLKNRVVEILHFDATQVAAYDGLIDQHRSSIRAKEQEMLDSRRQLYALLSGGDLSRKDSLSRKIGALQSDIENIHFEHFSQVKSLCRPDQLSGFQKIADEMMHFLAPKGMPPPSRQ